jgi:hypothetical protein
VRVGVRVAVRLGVRPGVRLWVRPGARLWVWLVGGRRRLRVRVL